jgi:hypothetical protein
VAMRTGSTLNFLLGDHPSFHSGQAGKHCHHHQQQRGKERGDEVLPVGWAEVCVEHHPDDDVVHWPAAGEQLWNVLLWC